MNRRLLLLAAALAAAARAQRPPVRLAWLSPNERAQWIGTYEAFLAGMADHGYVAGRDFTVDERWADASRERLAALAQEVVAARPEIVVTQTVAIFEVLRFAPQQKVVFGFSGDPIVAKLGDSLARPGRSATGVSLLAVDLVGKRMELLKELVPGLRRVAVIANPAHAGVEAERDATLDAARRLGLTVDYHNVRGMAELQAALALAEKADGLVLFPDNGTMRYSEAIAAFSRAKRVPAISGWAEFAERGNILAYGPDLKAAYRRLASHVDKILKGRSPAQIPIELPTRVELVVNLAAARDLRITVPASILSRADRVLE